MILSLFSPCLNGSVYRFAEGGCIGILLSNIATEGMHAVVYIRACKYPKFNINEMKKNSTYKKLLDSLLWILVLASMPSKHVNADSFSKFESLFTNICECQNTHGKFVVDFWSDAYNKIFTFNWKLSA